MPREDLSPVAGEQSLYKLKSYQKFKGFSDKQEYIYTLMARPYGRDTQPEFGFVRHQDSGTIFGQVVFDHLLSPAQCRNYKLRPDSGLQALVGNLYANVNIQNGNYLLSIESYDSNTGFFKISKKQNGKNMSTSWLNWQDMIDILVRCEWRILSTTHNKQSFLWKKK